MQKKVEALKYDLEQLTLLEKELQLPKVLCHLLLQRQYTTPFSAKNFLSPNISQLHHPYLMKDMEKAVHRIRTAINQKEHILLYGDYDVDGTTSVAMLFESLEKVTPYLSYYIPNRVKEGYGLSFEGIEFAHQNKVVLIISLDCGINASNEVDLASSLGIDLIIVDHHLPKVDLPNALAILNPKREDCTYPYKELSAGGITFKLIQAIEEEYDLKDKTKGYLDLLVLSIASDLVEMTGENRVLSYYGLNKLNQTSRPGLKALIQRSQHFPPFTISKIVFGLAPMINAAGRLADADQAVKLFLSKEISIADHYAKVLLHRNKIRKAFDQEATEEALKMIETEEKKKSVIVLYQPHWHIGVLGIVASRVAKACGVPTIILSRSEGKIVGSGRSVNEIDLFKAISCCEDILINFGGHKYAIGLSIYKDRIPFFYFKLEEAIKSQINELQLVPKPLTTPLNLNLHEIDPILIKGLKKFAPFGPENRNPVFLAKDGFSILDIRLYKKEHLSLTFKTTKEIYFKGIAFNKGVYFHKIRKGEKFKFCYTIEENIWRGKKSINLYIKEFYFDD